MFEIMVPIIILIFLIVLWKTLKSRSIKKSQPKNASTSNNNKDTVPGEKYSFDPFDKREDEYLVEGLSVDTKHSDTKISTNPPLPRQNKSETACHESSSAECCTNNHTGKYFIVIDVINENEAKMINPNGDELLLDSNLFSEPETKDIIKLYADNLLTKEQFEKFSVINQQKETNTSNGSHINLKQNGSLMTDEQLKRSLVAVGKKCFIEFLSDFGNENLSNKEVAERISKEKKYTWKSCLSRTSRARSIIRSGCLQDALEQILDSKVSEEVKHKAKMELEYL